MKALTVLKKARKYIEKGWTKGHFAVDKRGIGIQENDKNAAKWCLDGALSRVDPDFTASGYHKASDFLSDVTKTSMLTQWNDNPKRTKKQVLEVFDKAIKLAEKEGA